jgi:hypothetical protein
MEFVARMQELTAKDKKWWEREISVTDGELGEKSRSASSTEYPRSAGAPEKHCKSAREPYMRF